jgi:6-phosphogluconate dehydrogenase
MQLGMVGLGRMGGNIVRRLMRADHQCVVYDRSADAIRDLTKEGATAASGLGDFAAKLKAPRAVWVMLPAGEATEDAVAELGQHMAAGDVIIDGGNSFYKDDVRRARMLKAKGIHYLDVGTSGGIWGIERGYCMMIGGDKAAVDRLDPIFAALAPGIGNIPRTPGRDGRDRRAEQGYVHCGPSGAGHFVKMIHNGIEYGLMQAYAEGFAILHHAKANDRPDDERYDLNVTDIAEVWRRGSVISSWLLDLTASALAANDKLEGFTGVVEDSGEGRWTVMAAIEEAVPAPVISAALYERFRSREQNAFADKLLSAMRKGFGGHVEPRSGGPRSGEPGSGEPRSGS